MLGAGPTMWQCFASAAEGWMAEEAVLRPEPDARAQSVGKGPSCRAFTTWTSSGTSSPRPFDWLARKIIMTGILRSSPVGWDQWFSERETETRNDKMTCPLQLSFNQGTQTATQPRVHHCFSNHRVTDLGRTSGKPHSVPALSQDKISLSIPGGGDSSTSLGCLRGHYLAGLESYFQAIWIKEKRNNLTCYREDSNWELGKLPHSLSDIKVGAWFSTSKLSARRSESNSLNMVCGQNLPSEYFLMNSDALAALRTPVHFPGNAEGSCRWFQ